MMNVLAIFLVEALKNTYWSEKYKSFIYFNVAIENIRKFLVGVLLFLMIFQMRAISYQAFNLNIALACI